MNTPHQKQPYVIDLTRDDTIVLDDSVVLFESDSDDHESDILPVSSEATDNLEASPTKSSDGGAQPARIRTKTAKQIEKDKERLVKEANRANAANKAVENCTTILHRNVLNLIQDTEEITIKTLFDESCINYELIDDSKYENSITWSIKRTEVESDRCVSKYSNSDWIIVVMNGEEYLRRILLYRDDRQNKDSLDNYICDIRRKSGLNIMLYVYSLSNYLKSAKQKDARDYRKKFKDRFENRDQGYNVCDETTTTTNSSNIGTTDLQDLRLMLEIELKYENTDWNFHFEFFEKTQELVQSLARYTLSIAKYELKRRAQTSTELDWAINMDKERAIDPTRSSNDLTKLWITQLQQFSNIGLPMAKAIAAEYPSPGALLDQYNCLSESEGEELLASLSVQRNLRRQVGLAISRKIHRFMTSRDPDIHIGYN